MPWTITQQDGLWLAQIGWWLDAQRPVERSFVSHAHFDHLAAHREVICSAGTARLMRARLEGTRVEHILPFGQGEQLTPDCAVTLHPAGHIFGSAQALLEHAVHGRLLYTGDFKLRPSLSAEPCATPRADVLVMETTYGLPRYAFPPTAQVLSDIVQFCQDALEGGIVPVLFGYSLGKSQEILSSLAGAGLNIMLHPQTAKLTRVYEEFGLKFPAYREFAAEEALGHVLICPHQTAGSSFLRRLPEHRTAMITGWALDASAVYQYRCDAAFPLSDHADYPDLLRFVEAVQPSRVYTVHGFAREFAHTLRERGVEAWALGLENQLELLQAGPVGGRREAASRKAEELEPVSREAVSQIPEAFRRFAAVAEAVGGTSGKLEKVSLLAEYFRSLETADFGRAALYFTGRPFPQSGGRTLNLGWAILKGAVLSVSGAKEEELRAAYHRHADAGEAAEAVLGGAGAGKPVGGEPVVSLSEIAGFFERAAGSRTIVEKLGLMEAQLRRLSAVEAKYLVKIVTGDLRIGLKEGLVEEAVAAASGQPLEEVRAAGMLNGNIAAVAEAARAGTLGAVQLQVFHPVQFMLASPAATAKEMVERLGVPLWLEEKYDGIRCQVHKQGSRAEIYSRDLRRITNQFPDLARAALALPRDFVGDGELLAWRDGRALPFAELQKRLGRKGDDFFLGAEIPVSVSLYDLLWIDGRSVLKEPLSERRRLLSEAVGGNSGGGNPVGGPEFFRLAPVQMASSEVEIEAGFIAARQRGNEGLMAKDPRSTYTPGRRGLAWLKLKKAYATLDVVVVGVEYGHGKRRAVLSDYTFAIRDTESGRLLTVGKAYSGLTDVEIASMTEHFMNNTLEERGRFRSVVPNVILEVAFDRIQPSARHESGFALRFPRIVRIRTDKTVAEIDTLETCRRLAAAMF